MHTHLITLPLVASALKASAASLFGRAAEDSAASSARVYFTNTADPFDFNVVDFEGDGQIIYVANITVAGQQFEVCLIIPILQSSD